MQTDTHQSASAVRTSGAALALGVALASVITVAALTWAKWDPYAHKLGKVLAAHAWSGKSILASAGQPAAHPSWHAAWAFTVAYGKAVWMALVAALLIAAAVDALLPRDRVVRLLSRRGLLGGSVTAGLLSVPAMMCTCCTAPVTATLKRQGVPTESVLSFQLGNPVLNPAVLVFLGLVAPWQWVATRVIVGVVLVFGVTIVISRIASRRGWSPRQAVIPDVPPDIRKTPVRFLTAIGRLVITLVPEYFVIVFLLGAFRGWLFPLGANTAHWGFLAVILAAVVGTLLVIPTAGEIPILQGLAAVGVGVMPLGVLLITLPAISLPSMAMIGRALTWRVVAMTGAAVAITGVASGVLLWALS